MKRYGVIMAGGEGARFWPLSRRALPKQFLNLTGKDILVNETIDRLSGLIPKEQLFLVTNQAYAELTLDRTAGRLPASHILAEPAARNTAACIGYAAMELVRKYEDGVMCVVPSDASIRDAEAYRAVLAQAADAAEETGGLVTVGITPTFPSTGYGYIRRGEGKTARPYAPVEEFVEKPDAETAAAYLADGGYLWNSGMFFWKASVILEKIRTLLPDVFACLEQIGEAMGTEREQETIARVYPAIPRISVDYGIMERAGDVYVLEGGFGWSDVGSYDALTALQEPDENGNLVRGDCALIDTENCICYADKRLIAAVGIKDAVIVESGDCVLVCDKKRAQDVKKITELLESCGKREYL